LPFMNKGANELLARQYVLVDRYVERMLAPG
jgi:hypothetical protein